MKSRFKAVSLLGAVALAFGAVGTAQAINGTAELFVNGQLVAIDNGTDAPSFVYGVSGDINTANGAVTFIFNLGNYSFTLTSGSSKPQNGATATDPYQDLTIQASTLSVANGYNSSLNNQITIDFVDYGYTTPNPSGAYAHLGVADNPAAQNVVVDYNTYVGTTAAGTTQGLGTGSAINYGTSLNSLVSSDGTSQSGAAVFAGGANYSLDQQVIINATGAGQGFSLDASLQVPDGGATVVLLGGSLLALGIFRRRFVATA